MLIACQPYGDLNPWSPWIWSTRQEAFILEKRQFKVHAHSRKRERERVKSGYNAFGDRACTHNHIGSLCNLLNSIFVLVFAYSTPFYAPKKCIDIQMSRHNNSAQVLTNL